jgi:hypothetical protein
VNRPALAVLLGYVLAVVGFVAIRLWQTRRQSSPAPTRAPDPAPLPEGYVETSVAGVFVNAKDDADAVELLLTVVR